MKPLLVIAFTFVFIAYGSAQNTNLAYKYAFKLYNLSTLTINTQTLQVRSLSAGRYEITESNLQAFKPTLGFQWKSKNGNFHEVELINVKFDSENMESVYIIDSNNNKQSSVGQKVTSTSIVARYEYLFCFNKATNSKWIPAIGVGVSPYYHIRATTPKTSNMFNTSISSLGASAFITPRLTYYVSSKVFIDLNIPVCVFDTYVDFNRVDNPAIAKSERTSSTFIHNVFPRLFSARLGVGLKI